MEKITIPIGPQHPLLKEPLSLRISVSGERVLGGELRLGYVHRGIEKLAVSRNYTQNVHLIERICGICSHVHTTAFCTAVERLLNLEVPARAHYIRALLCELERIHSHLLWAGILSKHIGLDTIFMHTWHDRELVLDIMEELSGGRVSHAVNKIGGVRIDLDIGHAELIKKNISKLHDEVEKLLEIIMHDSTIKARTQGVAIITPEEVKQYGIVGPIARASGVAVDFRSDDPLPPYDRLNFKIITQPEGDAWARTVVRIQEVHESMKLCEQILKVIPDGPVEVRARRSVPTGRVIVRAEAPRGELFYYLRSDGTNQPARLKIRTPSLPVLEILTKKLSEIQVADIPVVLAGVDLCIACADR